MRYGEKVTEKLTRQLFTNTEFHTFYTWEQEYVMNTHDRGKSGRSFPQFIDSDVYGNSGCDFGFGFQLIIVTTSIISNLIKWINSCTYEHKIRRLKLLSRTIQGEESFLLQLDFLNQY
jgi:hypothetical protein